MKPIGKKGKQHEGFVYAPHIPFYDTVSNPGFSNARMMFPWQRVKEIIEIIEKYGVYKILENFDINEIQEYVIKEKKRVD